MNKLAEDRDEQISLQNGWASLVDNFGLRLFPDGPRAEIKEDTERGGDTILISPISLCPVDLLAFLMEVTNRWREEPGVYRANIRPIPLEALKAAKKHLKQGLLTDIALGQGSKEEMMGAAKGRWVPMLETTSILTRVKSLGIWKKRKFPCWLAEIIVDGRSHIEAKVFQYRVNKILITDEDIDMLLRR